MSRNSDQSIQAWTDYWETGAPESCVVSAEGLSGLKNVWRRLVDNLPDGSKLLDLATGNGSVAVECVSRAKENNTRLTVSAVDLADIHPHRFRSDQRPELQHIRFLGNTRIEDLPFEDGAFDAVVSQFGFEYAQEDQAVQEISRVLSSGSQLGMAIHARNGAVSRAISERLSRLENVMSQEGILRIVLDLCRALESNDKATLAIRSRALPRALDQFREYSSRQIPGDSAVFYASEFLRMWAKRDRYWPADMRRSAEHGWANAKGNARRQSQMLEAARSENGMLRIKRRLANAGMESVSIERMRDPVTGDHVSWILRAIN